MRAAKSIRRLAVGALLPLSVAGCFEDKNVRFEISEVIGRDRTVDGCMLIVTATNGFDEHIEALIATVLVNGRPVQDGYGYGERNNFSTKKGGQRTDRIVIGQRYEEELFIKGDCPDNPEITNIEVEVCATGQRDCSEDVTF